MEVSSPMYMAAKLSMYVETIFFVNMADKVSTNMETILFMHLKKSCLCIKDNLFMR